VLRTAPRAGKNVLCRGKEKERGKTWKKGERKDGGLFSTGIKELALPLLGCEQQEKEKRLREMVRP